MARAHPAGSTARAARAAPRGRVRSAPRNAERSAPRDGERTAARNGERTAARDGVRTANARTGRIVGLDALRGIAIVAMIAYHFCFDLRWFGVARFDLEHDVAWIAARSAILGTFLLVAGASLALAARRDDFARGFARHVAIISAAALLVSVASYAAFPATFIWFGVLHAIAVSLLLAFPLARRPRIAAALGAVVVLAGVALSHPAFDTRALGWLGFMTHKPATEDYVPLAPWSGLLLIGIAFGAALAQAPEPLAPLARGPRVLPWLGRHSLLVYLVHQPILVALLWLATRR